LARPARSDGGDSQSGLPFSILDSAAGTLFGPATYFTTASLAPGKILQDAILNGSVSSRVNEYFNTNVFVPAPFIPDGGLIDGQYPATGGGTIFGNLLRNILRGPGQHNVDVALIKRTKLGKKASMVFRWEVFNVSIGPILRIRRAMFRVRARLEKSVR
jgi:hypothetical protein